MVPGIVAAACLGVPAVEWIAPPACPTVEAVQADLGELVDRDAKATEVRASAAVEGDPEVGFRMRLQIDTPRGSEVREWSERDCRALAGAAALFIATAIEAARDDEHATTVPLPAGPKTPVALVAAVPDRPDAAASDRGASARPRPEPRVAPRVGAGYHLAVGRESPVSHGPGIVFALTGRRLRLDLVARYAVPVVFEPQRNRRVRVQAAVASARGCWRAQAGRVEIPACAVAEAGLYWARGLDWARNARAQRPFLAAGLGLGLRVPISARIAAAVDVDALVPIIAAPLTVDATTVWRSSVVGGRLGIGIEAKFGGAKPRGSGDSTISEERVL